MAAHPIYTDPRCIEDFWRDVGTWLRQQDRTWSWLAVRLGMDAGALSRMASLQQHTPADLAMVVVAELGPGVGRSLADRAGVELVRVTWPRPSSRGEDARAALVTSGAVISGLCQGIADGDLDDEELESLRPELERMADALARLLRGHRPAAIGGAA